MDAFLGMEAFAGLGHPAPFTGSWVGQAVFNGCIAFCNWPADDVAAIVPPELELAVNASESPAVHPVVFLFGEQTEGATIFAGITFPLGVRYHEFAFAIPFVVHRRLRSVHTFVPRMYSSFYPATWAGNAHYGLAKQMTAMEWTGSRFAVAGPQDARPFDASVEPAGEWMAGARCTLDHFLAMQTVFAYPVMGRRDDGTYISSHFGFDFPAARVRSAHAQLSVDPTLARGVPRRTCSSLPSATFEVAGLMWRLSWPAPCRF